MIQTKLGHHLLNDTPHSPEKSPLGLFPPGAGSPAFLWWPSLQEEGQLWVAVSWRGRGLWLARHPLQAGGTTVIEALRGEP